MNERQILQKLATLTARLDAVEAAVDEIMKETGTGPVEGDAEAPAVPGAPSVPRRAKKDKPS